MRKITLLLAFGLSFLWNSTALAATDTTYLWWLKENGDKVTDWIAVDIDGGAWVNIKPTSPNYKKVRFAGAASHYFETDYRHVYINQLTATFHTKNGVTTGSGTIHFKDNYNFTFHLCEVAPISPAKAHSEHTKSSLEDGDLIVIKSIKEWIHVRVDHKESNSNFTIIAHGINDWTNITHSTSEGGYRNYLTNEYYPEDRKPNYFEVDEHYDGTYLLHPGWLCDTHTSYDEYYDHHAEVHDYNWTGGEDETVINMHDQYNGQIGGWQEVTLDHAGVYTVQAIVRGPADHKVKLRLTGTATAEKEEKVYGMDHDSPSTVNRFGRVDYWDMGTNGGWTKVETKVAVAANGNLKIELLSDAAFEVSDVTLLLDANDESNNECFWTTAALDEDNTSKVMLKQETIELQYEFSSGTFYVHFPFYNKFSFFDRGTNKNGVVYAHPKTVIGMPAGMADSDDHAHECNVAVPYYNVTSIYSVADENNVENETNITCKKLKLTDTDGSQWGNIHTFGLPEGKHFTANEVTFDRQYKSGQKSTCVFPFAMTSSELSDFFGSNTIYEFASIDGTTANFNEVTSGSTANKPFLVYPTKNGEISLGSKQIIANSNLTTENGGSKFVGTYKYLAFSPEYSPANGQGSKPLIYMFNAAHPTGYYGGIHKNGADIKPFRAYIEVPRSASAAPAGFFVNFVFNEQTAISDIFNENNGNQTIYRLDGTRVTNMNGLKKGVYIVNGKKVILK